MQLPIYDKSLEIMEEAERRFDVLPLSDEKEDSAKRWDHFCLAQTMKRARSRQKQLSCDNRDDKFKHVILSETKNPVK